jgi:hypothetical protein
MRRKCVFDFGQPKRGMPVDHDHRVVQAGPKRQDWISAASSDDSRSRWGFARRVFEERSGGRARRFHSFAMGGLALRQKGLRPPGIVMDRLPTPDIDSTCSEESSLRTAWISRRPRRPKTRAGGESG